MTDVCLLPWPAKAGKRRFTHGPAATWAARGVIELKNRLQRLMAEMCRSFNRLGWSDIGGYEDQLRDEVCVGVNRQLMKSLKATLPPGFRFDREEPSERAEPGRQIAEASGQTSPQKAKMFSN